MSTRLPQALWAVPILSLLFASPSAGQSLSASVLPASRSVQVGNPATAFATIINAGPAAGLGCAPSLATNVPASLAFQTTDPNTNQLTGTPNTPVDIPAGATRTFVITLTPSAPISRMDVSFNFACANAPPAPTISSVNTLLLSASTPGGPDVVALATTPSRDGVVNVGGTGETGVFAVATVNMGASGSITVSADTDGTSLPLTVVICRTAPATGICLDPPTTGSLTVQMGAGATQTFGLFVTATSTVPFNPAVNRIFVRFLDAGGVIRGLTGVAASAAPFLTRADVTAILRTAATAIDATTMVVAVTDREGNVLGVFRKSDAPATVTGNFGDTVNANDWAVALARTGAFFSNGQAPLSSRTVRFISGIHFPPNITNAPNAALYGIENTNRGCNLNAQFIPGQQITPAGSLNGLPCNSADQRGCGLGIATGKPDVFDSNGSVVNPGGVPIFKEGSLVGGVGVTGVALDSAEFAAFAASVPNAKFGPVVPAPGVIFLDGIQLPFVDQAGAPPGVGPGVFTNGPYVVDPRDSPLGAAGVPTGWLIGPMASPELSASDVITIVNQAVNIANQARAAIRLPLGSKTRMMIAVADLRGRIIGLFRMDDATIFSIDVSVAMARNVVFFSGFDRLPSDLPGVPMGTSVTSRTISFGAQPLYPPGIDSSPAGPFFQLFLNDVAIPCRQGSQPPNVNQSGIVFFPGSVALWKNGQMAGGLGVSGEGVEQDDLVTAGGATGFAPPLDVRADRVEIGGARLPFLKFPRNPCAPDECRTAASLPPAE